MWISNKWFKRIDTQMRELIWKKKVARISLTTLQYGKDRGDWRYLTLKLILWPLRYNSWQDGDGKKERI